MNRRNSIHTFTLLASALIAPGALAAITENKEYNPFDLEIVPEWEANALFEWKEDKGELFYFSIAKDGFCEEIKEKKQWLNSVLPGTLHSRRIKRPDFADGQENFEYMKSFKFNGESIEWSNIGYHVNYGDLHTLAGRAIYIPALRGKFGKW